VDPGQITITREDGTSLLLHHGTIYRVNEFNPFNRGVRADQGGDAPWSDGGWSGAEWLETATIPLRLGIHTSSWSNLMDAWWALNAALAPVRTGGDVELTWNVAGTEYLMYVRPRGARLKNERARTGKAWVEASFSAPDPAIYSAIEHTTTIGLLHRIGGFGVPFGLPVSIPSVVADGEATLINSGTAPARLLLHITGPCPAFRVSIITGTSVQTLNIDTVLGDDDFLDIDTKDKVVLLNGFITRLPDAWGDWPLLPPGESLLRFESDDYELLARLTTRHRDTH
jgi:hypothetical protein